MVIRFSSQSTAILISQSNTYINLSATSIFSPSTQNPANAPLALLHTTFQTNTHQSINMQFSIFSTILIAAAAVNAAPGTSVNNARQVENRGLLNLFSNTGCSGDPCNVFFPLQSGCNMIAPGCNKSASLRFLDPNCVGMLNYPYKRAYQR
jgi:hypothetical protein